jgi:hypothetical protein
MAGLTLAGFRDRIRRHQYELTEDEADDLFLLLPGLVDIHREKGKSTFVEISGLNLKFSIKD